MPMIMRWFTGHSWHKWGPLGPLGHRHGFMRIQTAPARWLQDSKLLFLWWSIIPCLALDKPLFRGGLSYRGWQDTCNFNFISKLKGPSVKPGPTGAWKISNSSALLWSSQSPHYRWYCPNYPSAIKRGNWTSHLHVIFPLKAPFIVDFPSQPWKWTTSPSAERCSVAETRRTPRCHGRWRCFPHDSAARVGLKIKPVRSGRWAGKIPEHNGASSSKPCLSSRRYNLV